MQSQKTWYLMVPGLFYGQKLRGPTPKRTGFSPSALLYHRAPEKCKESVFEAPILCRNQANPPILLHF